MGSLDTMERMDIGLAVLTREVSEISFVVKSVHERLEVMEEKMDAVKEDLARYRGLVGGVLWLAGILWAGLVFFKDWWR